MLWILFASCNRKIHQVILQNEYYIYNLKYEEGQKEPGIILIIQRCQRPRLSPTFRYSLLDVDFSS
jgi:hypothetical protein